MPPSSIPAIKESLIGARSSQCRDILARFRDQPSAGPELLAALLAGG
jgi:phosphotransferase system enzyme I (PtsI)